MSEHEERGEPLIRSIDESQLDEVADDDEVARLREENERLKQELERLRQH